MGNEEDCLKFERGTLTNRTDILRKIDSQGNRSWIQVRKVQKFSPLPRHNLNGSSEVNICLVNILVI